MESKYAPKFGLDSFEFYNFARQFRIKVYRLIRTLPPEEKFCLAPQMRRAAISVTNNIAERHGRWHYQENIRFCRIARGSVEEIIDDFNICVDENYADTTTIETLREEAHAMLARINSYIVYLRRNQQEN